MRESKRKNRSLSRQPAKKERYDLVLIVCEGEKTEPNYLQGLVEYEKLSSVNIHIEHTDGKSAPINVVNKAITLYQQRLTENNPDTLFDKVYCIFDRDQHSTFDSATQKAKSYQPKFETIHSYPSFEYWYLCHFKSSRALITTSKNCESLVNQEWKKVFQKDYRKSQLGIYQQLKSRQTIAIQHAKFAEQDAKSTDELNPSTQVHHLIEYLLNLKK